MAFAIIFPMIAIPISLSILIVFFIVSDIKSARRMRHFRNLIDTCQDMHGIAFTQRLLKTFAEGWMGLENMISVLEHHCCHPNDKSN